MYQFITKDFIIFVSSEMFQFEVFFVQQTEKKYASNGLKVGPQQVKHRLLQIQQRVEVLSTKYEELMHSKQLQLAVQLAQPTTQGEHVSVSIEVRVNQLLQWCQWCQWCTDCPQQEIGANVCNRTAQIKQRWKRSPSNVEI